MLAYSSVGQIGYIVLGAALTNQRAMTGGLLHILNHALMKGTLFLVVGSVVYKTGIENISDMKGLGKKMPYTMAAFTIGALSMIGFPLTAGFVSKWFLLIGSVEIGQIPLLLVLLASTFLNVAYFFPVIINAFFKRPDKELSYREAPLFMLIPLILTGIFSIILGILPDEPLAMVRIAVANLMGGK